jgi:hypothetical protein
MVDIARQLHEIATAIGKVALAIVVGAVIRMFFNE